MLHARRKRLKELAEAEALGQTFWTTTFDDEVRTRLQALFALCLPPGSSHLADVQAQQFAKQVANLLRLELGLNTGVNSIGSLVNFWRLGCSDELMPSLIEAVIEVSDDDCEHLATWFNEVFSEHRIGYELINGEMVEFESKELHQEVVAPTLRLLSGRPGWDNVETAYHHALGEISDGSAADAITDAGTALQEALTLLGCSGNALGPLVTSARKKGLLGAHDSGLIEGVQRIMTWVSADRSTLGDSHNAGGVATRDDAWFTVHVVGALILRLAGGPRPG